jgi:hypothetical protein
MKILYPAIFLLLSNLSFCQIKSVIIDSTTKIKIPYVNIWVENKNNGTTSNHRGEFEIAIHNTEVIIFSAIGFETRRILSDSIKDIVELKASITPLNEVVVSAKKQIDEVTIGSFKKSKINHYFGCGTKPWITARYFPFQENYRETRFLNKIRLLTNSNVRDVKFNIRLYKANDAGEPEGFIYDKNIIAIAKKRKKYK